MIVTFMPQHMNAQEKKFKQKIYGTWRNRKISVTQVADDQYYEQITISIYRFNHDGTGYLKTITDGLKTVRTTKKASLTVINMPFEYTTEKMEDGNKVSIKFKRGKVLYTTETVETSDRDSATIAKLDQLNQDYIDSYDGGSQTFYWTIVADDMNYNKKSLRYIDKDWRYKFYEKKPKRYDIWKYD